MAKLYVSNKDESVPLFKSRFLEIFTHVHWSVPLIIFVPVVSYFLYQAATTHALTLPRILLLFAGGTFVWTLTEYVIHRFIFHYEPKSAWGRRIHFLTHGVHHDYPNDSLRLVMVPAISVPLAILFYSLFYLLMGPALTAPFFAGFVTGYLLYDMIHYATHHAPMKSKLGLWLKHHHVRHHYQDYQRGYGVSSPLWDVIFGTMHRQIDRKSR